MSALYGTPCASSGILNNELYVGRYVWNRREWVKDPDNPTRRVPRLRPPDQWKIVERPDLRIVDNATWQAVRMRIDTPRRQGGQRGRGPPPRTLFGGLLRCGICGGAMVAVHKRYYGCAAHKDRGPAVCAGTFAPRAETDRRLIAGLREQVLTPEAIAKIRVRVCELLEDLQRRANSDANDRAARMSALQAEIDRLTDAVAQMGLSNALRTRLAAAEAELATLKAQGPGTPRVATADADRVGARIRRVALNLESALASDVDTARRILADKLGDIKVEERDDGVYAQMDIGPVLLEAAGADVAGIGCGGRI